jgi:diguanylate cyclase (GGDEF)-like protein/PAS domain S-box-containing protein
VITVSTVPGPAAAGGPAAWTTRPPVGVFAANADGEWVSANERLCELIGLSAEQALGSGWKRALHPDDAARAAAEWDRACRAREDVTIECRFRRSDGSVVRVEISASAVRDPRNASTGWVGTCVDPTDGAWIERRYRDLFDNARDVVFTADLAGNIASVNEAAERITGFERRELLGMSFFDLIAPDDLERVRAMLARNVAGEARDEIVELQLVAKDGRRVFVEVTGRVVEREGQAVGVEGIARDITTQHALQDELAHQAFHDALTGLPNRALLVDRLGQALARAERPGSRVAVMLLDLDHFKLVNDSLGHAIGDELLTAIAPRLVKTMRGRDTVARLGGDEFAFVLEDVRDDGELIAVAHRILSAFDEPLTVDSRTQRITASLGIALGSRGDDPDGLLRNADTAMYRAKAARPGSFELFDDAMHRRVRRELAVRNALADALRAGTDEIGLYYQPIVSLATGEVLGVEALARWLHPQWGWVSPTEFVELSERDSLITSLGKRVLVEAAGQARRWRDLCGGPLPLGVSVNVSPRQLAELDFVDFLTTTLESHGVAPAELGIEVTERVFIDEGDSIAADNLDELARLGVRLGLDDFGTGYSALASLKRFPFTTLKIDRYFVRSIQKPTDTEPIVVAVVSLGRAMCLTVIAEGVETRVQADYLRRVGCDAAQGYYYARPQPADELARYLAEIARRDERRRSVA